MKLQQEHTDTSILGENFEAESRKKAAWVEHIFTKPSAKDMTRMQRALTYGVIWLLATTTLYVGILIGYAPAFRQIAGLRNPFSAIQEVAQTRDDIAQLGASYVEGMGRIGTGMEQLAELRTTQASESNPTLVAVKSLRDGRPAWDAVLKDVNSAVKQTVESNDILQSIIVGGVSFNAETNQGTLSKVKVYANGDQSSLALAARFVQALEAEPSLKEVKSTAPSTQTETSSGAILTYTPLDITFSVQQQAEVTPKDPDKTVQDVQKEIELLKK